jgi:hypothetical protein
MAITRGARRSDVIREAVANAVAAIDPSSLLPRTPVNPLRHPLWWIRTQAGETRPYRWLRRLKLIAKTRANGGVCSIELRNPHMGFFAQVYWCIAIFQYCERHGLTPHIRCTGLNYVDAERGQDWLEYYFTKLQSETSDLRKVRYTSTIYDVKLVGLAVRQHTSMEEARCVFNRHLRESGREFTLDPDWYRTCLHLFFRSGALSRAARACRYRAGARGPELDRGGGRRLHGQFGPPYAAMADHLAPCYGNSVSGRGKGPPRRLWIEHH